MPEFPTRARRPGSASDFYTGKFFELFFGEKRCDILFRRQQLFRDEAQVIARRRHLRVAVVEKQFVPRFCFEQDSRGWIKCREFFQFDRRIVAVIRLRASFSANVAMAVNSRVSGER